MIDFSEITSRIFIRLDTQSDVVEFVTLASQQSDDIKLFITDNTGMLINARSLLGCMYAREFDDMQLISNNDKIHSIFSKFARN